MKAFRTSPIAVLLAAVLAAETGCAAEKANGDAAWSAERNGLRGRLAMRRSHVFNGTGIVVTYLELDNVSEVANPLLLPIDGSALTFRVVDEGGREMPVNVGIFSGLQVKLPELVLPHEGTLRYRIGPRGYGVPGDMAALVDVGPNFGWAIPKDGKAYYLTGVLSIAERKVDGEGHGLRWHGTVDLPPVRIPTEGERLDPGVVGPAIDRLGKLMLAQSGRDSEAATRELSLIDDPRVVPWYAEAVKTRSYSLKFEALSRLSRFEGEEALEGIKIGMATRGADIANTANATLAAGSADNIRHSAAIALARSPHPKAKALLLSMENDPAVAVRLTVAQTAARMDTLESLALLKRRKADADATVRTEAARLLKLRGE
jgi:hypothetical protein